VEEAKAEHLPFITYIMLLRKKSVLMLEIHPIQLYQQVGVTTWGSRIQAPSRLRSNEVRDPRRCGKISIFFFKKYAFLGIFWSKFLLKNAL